MKALPPDRKKHYSHPHAFSFHLGTTTLFSVSNVIVSYGMFATGK